MHYDGQPVPKPVKQVKSRAPGGNPHKAASMDQEDQLAHDLSKGTGIPMRRRLMSGSNPLKPADVYTDPRVRNPSHRWLSEAKIVGELTSQGKKVLSVELEWVDKILVEARQENALPMLIVQFRGDPRRFCLTRFDDQVRLLSEHKSLSDIVGDG